MTTLHLNPSKLVQLIYTIKAYQKAGEGLSKSHLFESVFFFIMENTTCTPNSYTDANRKTRSNLQEYILTIKAETTDFLCTSIRSWCETNSVELDWQFA